MSLSNVSFISPNGVWAPGSLMAERPPHTKKPVNSDDSTHHADHCRGDTKDLDDVDLMPVEIVVLGQGLSQTSDY